MRDTNIIYAQSFAGKADDEILKQDSKGRYVLARPLGYPSFLFRLKATWLVFSGKADALIWEDQ